MNDGAAKSFKPPIAIMYATLYPFLARRARECGYALAMHGSMGRDFDLIAVPWTEDAKSAEELVAHILNTTVETLYLSEGDEGKNGVAGLKPHGRRVWALHISKGAGAYLDLSVMPREAT